MYGCYSNCCGVHNNIITVKVTSSNYNRKHRPSLCTSLILLLIRRSRAGKNALDQSTNMPAQLYEDPDKPTSRGQGNYELTQCPAYESIATKPESPQTGVDQSSHYI